MSLESQTSNVRVAASTFCSLYAMRYGVQLSSVCELKPYFYQLCSVYNPHILL